MLTPYREAVQSPITKVAASSAELMQISGSGDRLEESHTGRRFNIGISQWSNPSAKSSRAPTPQGATGQDNHNFECNVWLVSRGQSQRLFRRILVGRGDRGIPWIP